PEAAMAPAIAVANSVFFIFKVPLTSSLFRSCLQACPVGALQPAWPGMLFFSGCRVPSREEVAAGAA
ncbi:hypothetical protein, partial [Halomonas campaniensis]|uniref:hypothetical protein n=1 Tax=Halomonas campaniensis TaxID=213554 RepID=UPI003562A373